MPRKNPIKALFFDFDGVLQDSEPYHFQAWTNLLKTMSLEPPFREKEFIGASDNLISANVIAAFGLNETVASLYEKKCRAYRELMKDLVFDTQEEEKVLKSLFGKYQMGIVSSAHSLDIAAFLKRQHLEPYFDFIIAQDHVEKHKPHPAPYLKALERSGVHPQAALAIEDSDVGLTSATQASLKTIWMNRHGIDPSAIQRSSPPLRNFLELPSLLEKLF